jgi:aspartyl protease
MSRERSQFVPLALVGWAVLSTICGSTEASATGPEQPGNAVRFHLYDDYLIVVPVMVNGAGPFNFLLDTGSTSTVIDPDLERQLNAPQVGGSTVVRISDTREDQRVRLDEVRVGPAMVKGLAPLVDGMEDATALVPGLRGVLGEDFLKKFDILIDYDKRWLRFDEPVPEGERCPFEQTGEYRGTQTINRLLVKVKFTEMSNEDLVLQLDTATKISRLFPASHVSLPRLAYATEGDGRSPAGSHPYRTPLYMHITLKMGATEVRDLSVAQVRGDDLSDAAGLLPAAIFRRIYISHSGKFLVLNPRPWKQMPQRKLVDLATLGVH